MACLCTDGSNRHKCGTAWHSTAQRRCLAQHGAVARRVSAPAGATRSRWCGAGRQRPAGARRDSAVSWAETAVHEGVPCRCAHHPGGQHGVSLCRWFKMRTPCPVLGACSQEVARSDPSHSAPRMHHWEHQSRTASTMRQSGSGPRHDRGSEACTPPVFVMRCVIRCSRSTVASSNGPRYLRHAVRWSMC
jgi:hypothetical protein